MMKEREKENVTFVEVLERERMSQYVCERKRGDLECRRKHRR